jgi:hypothetical protein
MMFVREYLRVLLPLTLLFAIYHLVAVPFLAPAKSDQATAKWDAPAIPDRDPWWESQFPEGAWQRNNPRIVKTENAILLFQTREEKSKTRWLFKPLTILLPQHKPDEPPKALVIQNTQGAEIEFKSAVEWSKEIPPIESGHLLGEITIDAPPSDANKENGMHIDARDVRINKRQIWTHQPIHMMLGNSRVDGRELQIQLDRDLLASERGTTKDDSPFNGLDFLQLYYVDRVEIALNNGGLWPSKQIPDAAQRKATATLKCGGSFLFQFHHSQAIFQNGVHMEHLVQGLPTDTFDCHELRLQVGRNESAPVPGAPSTALQSMAGSSVWRIDRLEAFGAAGRDNNDFSRWIKLVAPSMQAEAQGQYLVMDMLAGSVQLSNKLPNTAAREYPRVYLRRESLQVWSPEVQYWSPESVANSLSTKPSGPAPTKSDRLGALLASSGMAQIDSTAETWKLSWSKKLRIAPDRDDPSKDLVIVEGNANVSSSRQSRFLAEQLHLWLTPTNASMSAALAARYPNGNVPQFLPDRLHAQGDVVVNSPEMSARVENMKIWFAYLADVSNSNVPSATLPTTQPGNVISTTASTSGLVLAPSTGTPSPPVNQPPAAQITPPPATFAAPSNPMNVTGKSMQARVVASGNKTFIDNLQLDGSFTLTRDLASDTAPWPFTATGETLSLSQSSPEITDITIAGKPEHEAKVQLGSGWVQANELRLKQSENRFTIDHPGELIIPHEVLRRATTTPAHALVSAPNNSGGFLPALTPATVKNQPALNWIELPRLRWGQRMEFDGNIARFHGGVTIDCRLETDPDTLWHVLCSAKEMTVEMEQPVSFRDTSKRSRAPSQVAAIQLLGDVDVQMVQTDIRNTRRSIEHIKVPRLRFLIPTQTWVGDGPGELWSRRYAANSGLPIAMAAEATAAPRNNAAQQQLQCIHLSFMGRVEGAVGNRTATFFDRIEALMGPIATWDDALNVHKVERLGRNQTRLISDRLNIFDGSGLSWNQSPASNAGGNPSAWEVEAQSRVKLESNTERGEINVEADSMKYTASHDVVRIHGNARDAAVITHLASPNEPPNTFRINSAAFRLKTGEIYGQIEHVGGSMPAHLQRAGPRAPDPADGQPAVAPTNLLPNPRDPILQRQR